MTTFFIFITAFKLISQTVSLCNNQYMLPDPCNTAPEGCIWSGIGNEGECYPNTPDSSLLCDELFAQYECDLSVKNCCWDEFLEGQYCIGDCAAGTPAPVTPAPTFNKIGDFCYCPPASIVTNTPSAAPTQKPTAPPTKDGAKKPKGSTQCAINGVGDCCCDKVFGQQSLTFINEDPQERTIETMKWWFDGNTGNPLDIICEYNCIEYGESKICNISGWDYEAGGHQRRRDPYDSFETNTYFDITYVGGTTCYSYFHTSCSSDIVGYFDAKDTNVCNIKCTAWTDADPNRIDNCNNNQEVCVCANATLSPIPTVTSAPSHSPTVFINSICVPTQNPTLAPISPTQNPTKQPSISPTTNDPTQTPSSGPTTQTTGPTIMPSEAPTRTRAPSVAPTNPSVSPTNIPSQITDMPSLSPTNPTISQSPSQSPQTAQPSNVPSNNPTSSSETPTVTPTVTPTTAPTRDEDGQGDDGDGQGNDGDGQGGRLDTDNGSMGGLIGGLIAGIVIAFLCGLICAGVLFWKYKQGSDNTANHLSAQDEPMEVEIGNANRKVSTNPLFTSDNR